MRLTQQGRDDAKKSTPTSIQRRGIKFFANTVADILLILYNMFGHLMSAIRQKVITGIA